VSGVNLVSGVVAAPCSWLCYFAGDVMPVFRVVISTVIEVDTESEYLARYKSIEAASKCREDVYDKFSVVSCGITSSGPVPEFEPQAVKIEST
jgi:hypothetical protein